MQRRRKGHGNSSVNYKEQQKYRREVNNEKRRTPQKSAKQHSVDPNEYYTSPLKQKQDEATKALREYEKTLAKVDMQVQQYHEQEGQEDINAGSSYETTKALEKHRRNLERAHITCSVPLAWHQPMKEKIYRKVVERTRSVLGFLLLGRLEDDIDAIEQPVEKTVPPQSNDERMRKLQEIEARHLQRSEYHETVLPDDLSSQRERKVKKQIQNRA